jgi:PAS domain S-box-containing protein
MVKILIAEAEPVVAKDIERTLRHMGYKPVAAVNTFADAAVAAEKLQPELVLMDSTLTENPADNKVSGNIYELPVIFLTPFIDLSRFEKSGFTNIYGHILKPFKESEMSAAIETAMRQHRKQQELQEQAEMLSAVLDTLPDGIIVLDGADSIIYANSVFCELFKKSANEIAGENLLTLCSFSDPATGQAADIFAENPLKEVIVKTDSVCTAAEVSVSPFKNTDKGWRTVTLRAFKKDERPDLYSVFHNPHISILLVNKDYTIEAFNKKAFEIAYHATGGTLRLKENILEYNFKGFKEVLDDILKGETRTYTFPAGKGGEKIWYEFNFYPTTGKNGEITGVCATGYEVTSRKLSELALQESEERYKLFVDQISEGIWRLELDEPMPVNLSPEEQIEFAFKKCYVADCNDAMARMYGLQSARQLIGTYISELFKNGDAENAEVLKSFILNGYRNINFQTHERDSEGNSVYFCNNSFGVVENNHLLRIWGTQQDITQQKNIEAALRRSEEKYKAVVDNLNEGIVITDEHDNIIFANHRMSELSSYSEEELLQKPVNSLIPEREGLEHILRERMSQRLEGISGKYNEQIRRRDGTVIWVEISAAPFFDSKGKIIGSIGVFSDITVRIEAEEALKISEERYRRLVSNAPVGITRLLVKEDRYELVNNTFLMQTGLDISDFEDGNKHSRASMIHPDDYQRVASFAREWKENGFKGFRHITYRITNKNNRLVWLDTFSYADFDENGIATAINQISIDVTDLKNAEAALAETLQQDFKNTVQNLQIIVFKFYRRDDGKYAYSLREGKLAGELTTEKVRGKNPHEVFSYYGADTDELVERAFAGESVQSEQFYEGRWRMVIYEPIFKDGNVVEVVGSSIDISPRKQAEQQLRDSEQRYKLLLEYLPIGILQEEANAAGEKIGEYINAAFEKHSGFTREEFSSFKNGEISGRIHPEDRAKAVQMYRDWREAPDDGVLHVSYRFKDKLGEYRWLDNYIIKFPTARGKVYLQAALDVTEQKKNEAKLRTTTSRLRVLIENLQAGVLVQDATRQVVLVNQNFCSIFGFEEPPEEVLLKDSQSILKTVQQNFKNREEFRQRVEEIIQNRSVVSGEEISFLDGRTMERDFIPIFVDNVYQGHLWQYRDITARKNTERELRRALEKERELGILRTRFVSTVSHEFRTPLTGIMVSAELIEAYAEQMSKEQRIAEIQKIKSRVDELVSLLNDFLLQSSATNLRERFHPVPISVEEIIKRVAYEIQESLVGKKQRLHLEIDSSIPQVLGDKRILHYVLNNLLSNASKYSEPGKSIYFNVKSEYKTVTIEIRDEGIGIPPEELEHIFTPYFRASNVGDTTGTGLGLPTAKEFIELHNGTISVESELGKFTLCKIILPVME